MTNKREWDTFSRQIQSRKVFPVALSQYVVKCKNDLFQAWLDGGKKWDQCQLIMERRQKSSNEASSGWIAVAGKKLVEEMGEEKGKLVMDRRTRAGMFYDNEDFPDDPMERMYYMPKAREVTHRETTEDMSKMQGKSHCDEDLLKALTGEEGVMRAGALPNLHAKNAAGQKALLDGMTESGVQAAPKRRKVEDDSEKSKEVKAKTLKEKVTDLMAAVLAENIAARKKSMSLGAVNYAGELASKLLDHAERMEKHYKTLQTAVGSNLEDDEFFKKCIGKIEKEQKWFITAEALFFQNCSIGMY